ncbi:MAG: sel1 repeat family protein, partial [Alphaproteobacteria bacterium]|nr:sel1 repeat family protein [Alphaproteobacteria bacterium]
MLDCFALLAMTVCVALYLTPVVAWSATADAPAPDFAFGAYQRGDYAVAMKEAKKRIAANPKDAAALALIGRLYLEGAGVARDLSIAMEWFKRGADAGDGEAAFL